MLSFLTAAAIVCNSLEVDAPRAWRLDHSSFGTFTADFDGDGRRDIAGTVIGRFTIRYGTGGGQFSEPVALPLDVVGVADLVGDPLPDLIVAGEGVRENRGGRDFSTLVPATAVAGLPVVADFTGDGRDDVFVPAQRRHVLLTFAGGTPQVVSQFDLGMYSRDIDAEDFDGDGDLDLIVWHAWDNTYRIYDGDGRGNFTPGPLTASDTRFESADLDRDGRVDRVSTIRAEAGPPSIEVRYGNGSTTRLTLPRGVDGAELTLHDLDGDGDLDIAVRLYPPSLGIRLYFNDRGTLTPSPQTILFDGIAAAEDFTGDGVPDLLASAYPALAILEGTGNGTFRVPPRLPLPPSIWHGRPIAADVDGDGLDELIYWSNDPEGYVTVRPDGTGGFTIERLPAPLTTEAAVSLGELALGTGYTGTVTIFTRGAARWLPSRTLSLPPFMDMALGDFNGDGTNELAVITGSDAGPSLRVLDTRTHQVFLDIPLPPGQAEYDVLAYQGRLFLTLGGTATELPGSPPRQEVKPDGSVTQYTFTATGAPVQQTVLAGAELYSTVAGDFNGDGHTDVLSASFLLLGTPTSGFRAPRIVPGLSRRRVAGDLNDDGVTDLVAMDGMLFTYWLGSPSGLRRDREEWTGVGETIPVIARLRRDRLPSLVFGYAELVEVTTRCATADPARRRGARH